MKRFFFKCALVLLPIILSGCSSLAVMKHAEKITGATSETALINFVRPHILMGDGVAFEVWDGSNFVGTLKSGAMIQYVANPGSHCFMIDPTSGGPWAHMNINVEASKVYYIKPNTGFVTFVLGLADASDERIPSWNKSLTPITIDKSKTKDLPIEAVEKAKQNVENFKNL